MRHFDINGIEIIGGYGNMDKVVYSTDDPDDIILKPLSPLKQFKIENGQVSVVDREQTEVLKTNICAFVHDEQLKKGLLVTGTFIINGITIENHTAYVPITSNVKSNLSFLLEAYSSGMDRQVPLTIDSNTYLLIKSVAEAKELFKTGANVIIDLSGLSASWKRKLNEYATVEEYSSAVSEAFNLVVYHVTI